MSRIVIPIRRTRKVEAVKAMNALVERGFNILVPLTEVRTTIEHRGNFNYRRGKYESKGSSVVTCWYAKLEGVKRNEMSNL